MFYEIIIYKYEDLFGSLIMFGRIDLMGWGHNDSHDSKKLPFCKRHCQFHFLYIYRTGEAIKLKLWEIISSHSAAIIGVQVGISYLVLTLALWFGLCPMRWNNGVWNFAEVSLTYRLGFGNRTLAGALCSSTILPEPAFSFTTGTLFYRTKLNSVPIFSSSFNLYIFWHLCRHVNRLKCFKCRDIGQFFLIIIIHLSVW